MNKHLRAVSRNRVAMAGEDGGFSFNFDIVTFLTFMVAVLTALDGLFTRKAESES